MAVAYAQCLLFIINETGENSTRKLRRSARRSKTSASSSVKGYVLCSEAFQSKRPEVLEIFKQNDLLLLSDQTVPALRLGKDVTLELIELLLDDNPSACSHSLQVVSSKINKEVLGLVFSKVTVFVKSKKGSKYVQPAIDVANFEIIKHLVTSGAAIHCKSNRGDSFLHLAVWRGPESLVKLVLEHCAEIDLQNCGRRTPLHLAVEKNSVPIVRLLLKHGANIQAGMIVGITALHIAASFNFVPMVELLLRSGAVVDCKNNHGFTALHLAAAAGNSNVVEILFLNGADVNARTDRQRTPISFAVRKGHIKVVEMLLKFGALVSGEDSANKSLLHAACHKHRVYVFQYLLESSFLDPKSLGEINIIASFLSFQNFVNINGLAIIQNIRANFKICSQILAHHVVKIAVLDLHPMPDVIDVLPLWADTFPMSYIDFKTECENEVACMKRQTLGNTDLSVYDILAKDPSKVACVLRNNSVAESASCDKWLEKFPIYGTILSHSLQKGKELKMMLDDGIKICNFLFCHFKKLPYELKEIILGYLHTRDFLVLKKVCGHFNKS